MVDFSPTVQAPRAVSYGAPAVDFSPLSQLYDSYYNTEQKARESNIAKTFQNGLPTDANGNPDFNQVMQELAKRGAISQLPALANLGLQRQLLSAALSEGGLPGPGGAPAAVPSAITASPTAPATPRPVGDLPNGGFAPPRSSSGAQPTNGYTGGDNGQNSLTAIVSQHMPEELAGPVINELSAKMKVDPNQPLTPAQQSLVTGYASRLSSSATQEASLPSGTATDAGAPAVQPPVRVAGGPLSTAPAPAPTAPTAPPAPIAGPPPGPMPTPAGTPPAGQPSTNPAAALLPPGVTDARAFAARLRQRASALALSPLTAAVAKQYEDRAKAIEDALQPTPDQKNAASVGMNPLQYGRAQEAGKVDEQNRLLTPELKAYGLGKLPNETLPEYETRLASMKKQAEVNAENSAIPPAVKQFLFDRRPNETLTEYESRLAGAKKFSEDEAARFGKKYDAISKAGAEASIELPQLQLAKSLMADPNFYSGPIEGVNLAYKRILASIDPTQANAAQPQEAFRKVVSNSILSQIRSLAGTGQIRVAEIRIMEKAAANAENTPAANRLLVEIATRLHQHALDLDQIARNYNGGRLDPGFDTVARDYAKQHPLFTEQELKDTRRIAPPVFATPAAATASGLPKGTPIQLPDGTPGWIP